MFLQRLFRYGCPLGVHGISHPTRTWNRGVWASSHDHVPFILTKPYVLHIDTVLVTLVRLPSCHARKVASLIQRRHLSSHIGITGYSNSRGSGCCQRLFGRIGSGCYQPATFAPSTSTPFYSSTVEALKRHDPSRELV